MLSFKPQLTSIRGGGGRPLVGAVGCDAGSEGHGEVGNTDEEDWS